MASELDDLLAQFPAWTTALDAWHQKIPKVDYFSLMQAARGTDHGLEDVVEAGKQAMAKAGVKPDVMPLIERLCQFYLSTSPEDRGRIHSAFVANRTMRITLEEWYDSAPLRIHSTADVDQVRTALAAVAIEDAHGIDWRDTLMALMGLAKAAEAAGIDHRPYVREVIALATATPDAYTEAPNAEGVLRRFAEPSLPW